MFFSLPLLSISCLLPLMMLVVGLRWKTAIPARNAKFSYRTTLACKSEETWAFAHRCFAARCRRQGGILLIASLVLLFASFVVAPTWSSVMTMALVCLHALSVLLLILPVENAIYHHFGGSSSDGTHTAC